MNRTTTCTCLNLSLRIFIAGLGAAASAPAVGAGESPSPVVVISTPEGGIQPQAVVDATGAVHLIWFKGISAGGDLYYARSKAGKAEFSAPIRVNSQPGTRSPRARFGAASSRSVATGGSMSPGTARTAHRLRTRSRAARCSIRG